MTLSRTQITKFVYVGQGGPLSTIPLQYLYKKGFIPEIVIVADKSRQPRGLNLLPVRPPHLDNNLAGVADRLGIPTISWRKGAETDVAAKLAEIAPEVAIMSCFPWRISEPLLAIPSIAWWNLHPSLLPRYRGPSPLFWQAKAGETITGISLHEVVDELDAGPILSQQEVSMVAFQGRELEIELAQQGAKLVVKALSALAADRLVTQQQREADATYQGFPTLQDRCVARAGAASEAYRFIMLVHSAYTLWLKVNGKHYVVKRAIGFDDNKQMATPFLFDGEQLNVQFERGVLTLLVEEQ